MSEVKLCECGCGRPTLPAKRSERGYKRGELQRFLHGHNNGKRKHGYTREGWAAPTYHSWQAMMSRCFNPNAPGYDRYGGRGITVCELFRDFRVFLAFMGDRPDGRTLDRMDNDGHYEPGNCQWATLSQQARNRRERLRAPNGTWLPAEDELAAAAA